jgi:hypothetical protein
MINPQQHYSNALNVECPYAIQTEQVLGWEGKKHAYLNTKIVCMMRLVAVVIIIFTKSFHLN